jgi:hypothetical protein
LSTREVTLAIILIGSLLIPISSLWVTALVEWLAAPVNHFRNKQFNRSPSVRIFLEENSL